VADNKLAKISEIERQIVTATDPKVTFEIEGVSKAEQALAKEQRDFEKVIEYGRIYLLAKRKTTELIEPRITYGGDRRSEQFQGNEIVTLKSYGFDKMEWSRRTKLLDFPEDYIDEFIDDCITKSKEPTFYGYLNFIKKYTEPIEDDAEPEIDKAEELRQKWGVEPGQVWMLGNHQLICGDCNDPIIFKSALAIGKPTMILADPPYGMNLDTDYSKMPSTKPEGNKTYDPIMGDSQEFQYNNFGLDCNEEFWFGADYYRRSIPEGGSWLVWDKRVEEKFDAMIGSAFELIWSKNEHKREIIRCNNTLFSGEAEAKNKLHPTMKPTKVVAWILSKYSNKKQIVIDMYSGSGSTIIACENLERICTAIEIEPKYVAVTLQRFLDAFEIEPIMKEGSWQA
jgi:DNA modification methylase